MTALPTSTGDSPSASELADALVQFVSDPTRVVDMPRAAILELLGALRLAEITLLAAQLRIPAAPRNEAMPAAVVESWLTADEVALRLRRTRTWVYRQARRWSFAKRPTARTLLISERGLSAWMGRR